MGVLPQIKKPDWRRCILRLDHGTTAAAVLVAMLPSTSVTVADTDVPRWEKGRYHVTRYGAAMDVCTTGLKKKAVKKSTFAIPAGLATVAIAVAV
jgi:hypothetical protein